MTKPRMIVVASDLHVGSLFALAPADIDAKLIDSEVIHGYILRDWLRKQWADFIQWVLAKTSGDPFIVVLNGDIIEGQHHGGRELLIGSITKQYRAAIRVVRPLTEHAHSVYFTEGTECHSTDIETDLAEDLQAIGGVAHHRLKITMNGLRHTFVHHLPTSARAWTEASGLGAMMAQEFINSTLAGEEPTDILVGAHRHKRGLIRSSTGMCIATPSWQLLTRHGRKVVPMERPTVGGCIIDHRHSDFRQAPLVHEFERRPAPDKGYSHD